MNIKDKVKKKLKKKMLKWLAATIGGFFVAILPYVIIVVVAFGVILIPLSFDLNLPDFLKEGDFDFLENQEKLAFEKKILDAQEYINEEYGEGLAINGGLIGSTVQTALLYNSDLDKSYMTSTSYNSLGLTSSYYSNAFPEQELVNEMVEAMIIQRVTTECLKREVDVDLDENDMPIKVVTWVHDSYITNVYKDGEPVDGFAISSCPLDQKENEEIVKTENIVSDLYYITVYLYDFFASEEVMDLDKTIPEEKAEIDMYVEETINNYNLYTKLIYGSDYPLLGGVKYIETTPIITKDGKEALPLGLYPVIPVLKNENGFYYGSYITSLFSVSRFHPMLKIERSHDGVDIGCDGGNPPIYAIKSGDVLYTGYEGNYGNIVKIDHGGGIVTLYAHLLLISVSSGDKINAGDEIGLCGSTGGISTGNHLHLEYQSNGNPEDPVKSILEDIRKKLVNERS